MRTRLFVTCVVLAVMALGSLDVSAFAQERSTLVRMLAEARDFRVRARAALALGSSGDSSAVSPLSTALREDDSAAVRAAAASALASIGSADALPALRAASGDSSPDVRDAADAAIRSLSSASAGGSTARSGSGSGSATGRAPPSRIDWSTTHFAVVMGSMENRSTFTHTGLGPMLQQEVHRGLSSVRGVAILDGGSAHADADREIARRSIPAFRMEGSISAIHREHRDGQIRVRCDVAILLMDEPGRNLRASLSASSTAMEDASATAAGRTAQERRLAEQALAAATARAMGGAGRALAAAGH